MDLPYAYNPQDIYNSQAGATVAAKAAGNRAQARHGVAFDKFQYLELYQEAKGIHTWDLGLRSSSQAAIRERLIQDTRNDLHNMVSRLY